MWGTASACVSPDAVGEGGANPGGRTGAVDAPPARAGSLAAKDGRGPRSGRRRPSERPVPQVPESRRDDDRGQRRLEDRKGRDLGWNGSPDGACNRGVPHGGHGVVGAVLASVPACLGTVPGLQLPARAPAGAAGERRRLQLPGTVRVHADADPSRQEEEPRVRKEDQREDAPHHDAARSTTTPRRGGTPGRTAAPSSALRANLSQEGSAIR